MARLDDLKSMLAARKGKKEYAESVRAIKKEIARHENHPAPIDDELLLEEKDEIK